MNKLALILASAQALYLQEGPQGYDDPCADAADVGACLDDLFAGMGDDFPGMNGGDAGMDSDNWDWDAEMPSTDYGNQGPGYFGGNDAGTGMGGGYGN